MGTKSQLQVVLYSPLILYFPILFFHSAEWGRKQAQEEVHSRIQMWCSFELQGIVGPRVRCHTHNCLVQCILREHGDRLHFKRMARDSSKKMLHYLNALFNSHASGGCARGTGASHCKPFFALDVTIWFNLKVSLHVENSTELESALRKPTLFSKCLFSVYFKSSNSCEYKWEFLHEQHVVISHCHFFSLLCHW